ncbi:MAG: hypothetical protein IPK60_10270 [Sandaracinaceae bacterium]|nr:hypothetical protein [Sandaracinaceae bacterium]
MTKKQSGNRKGQSRGGANMAKSTVSKATSVSKDIFAAVLSPIGISAMVVAATAALGFVFLRPRSNRIWIAKQFGGLKTKVSELSANVFHKADSAVGTAREMSRLDGGNAGSNGSRAHSA